MDIPVAEEFIGICRQIIDADKSLEEWAATESEITYRSDHFVGGFDADEGLFCFSYFDDERVEYWFEISLDDAGRIVNGEKSILEGLRRVQRFE